MKQAITIRIDPGLLLAARSSAEAENRTLTNFIETLMRNYLSKTPASRSAESRIDYMPPVGERFSRPAGNKTEKPHCG